MTEMTRDAKAAARVAKILAETQPEPLTAWETDKIAPFEFDWGWTGQIGNSDYVYKRREIKPVQGRAAKDDSTSPRRSRGTRSSARATTLAATTFDCPTCNRTHGLMEVCG